MAKVAIIHMLPSAFLVLSLFFSAGLPALGARDEKTYGVFGRTLEPNLIGKEKLTHFRFYWHDIVSGKNLSSIEVVHPPVTNSSLLVRFGKINIFDNHMTIGPEYNSRLVGRAQGFYAQPDQTEDALLLYQNFLFLEGKYNGSTVTVLGRNPILNVTRELTIVGGSGVFRFARGYALLTTNFFDLKSLNAIVEYNVYVLHYE